MRRWFGSLHLKDAFTLVNLVSGVVAVHYVLIDEPRRAGYAVIMGYLFGDLLDGGVARLTHKSNRFGAELDSIVDHFVHVMVPGLILYTVFQDYGYERLGVITLGVLVGAATLRHARLAAASFDFPLAWCGLPRTISGFAAMSLPLSKVFTDHLPNDKWFGVAIIGLLSLLNLAPIPYMTHRGRRAMQPWVKVFVFLFIITPVITFFISREWTFDVFLFWILGYALTGWVPVHRDERQAFREEYRRWSATLATR